MINNINVVLLHHEISAKICLKKLEHVYNVRKLTRKKLETEERKNVILATRKEGRKRGKLFCFKIHALNEQIH